MASLLAFEDFYLCDKLFLKMTQFHEFAYGVAFVCEEVFHHFMQRLHSSKDEENCFNFIRKHRNERVKFLCKQMDFKKRGV